MRKQKTAMNSFALISSAGARVLDEEASAQWGLDPFALVEAAGRTCADAFLRFFLAKARRREGRHRIKLRVSAPRTEGTMREVFGNSFVVLAGSGNNAADALVMLRALILRGYVQRTSCTVIAARIPNGEKTPLSKAMLSVQKLGVVVLPWEKAKTVSVFDDAGIIIDGIAGTGLDGPLRGAALEMAEAVNALQGKKDTPYIIAIDLPSGNFDGWQPGMPVINAHATLAIEPQKLCLYTPSARIHAGEILGVSGIFPPELIEKHREAELFGWESASTLIPQVPKTAYKYERGIVEIRAGSPGATGAARLAALGAQAAGTGLVRLIVDPSLYPIIAPASLGIMVVPDGEVAQENRFSPTAVLLGPGWGKGEDRMRLLETYLPLEEQGLPLILDADAIGLAKKNVFHGNAILTPHPGEFALYTGLPKETITADPVPILRRFSAERKVVILFKSHVLYIAAPDGRIAVIDGMNPALAAGGSGDVLAGFCAAIASRWRAGKQKSGPFDGYACACAAATLLIRAAESIAGRFADPAEVADAAASIAGKAWLLPINKA